jgi:hypothetical protein
MMVEDFPDSDNYKNAFAIRHEERSFLVFADVSARDFLFGV